MRNVWWYIFYPDTKSKDKLAHLAREWIASKGQIVVANQVALQACVQAHNEGQIASKGPIYTLLDLLNNSQSDFVKMKHFHREDIKHALDIFEIENDFV